MERLEDGMRNSELSEKQDPELNKNLLKKIGWQEGDFMHCFTQDEIDSAISFTSIVNKQLSIKKILVKEGQSILEGERIQKLEKDESSSYSYYITAEISGQLLYAKKELDEILPGHIAYVIRPKNITIKDCINRIKKYKLVHINKTFSNSEKNVYSVEYDQGETVYLIEYFDSFEGDFIETQKINFYPSKSDGYFCFSFLWDKSKTCLKISGYEKRFPMSSGDKIIFMITNGEVVELLIKSQPKRIGKDYKGIEVENKIILNHDQLTKLVKEGITNWKLISSKKNIEVIGRRIPQTEIIYNFQQLFLSQLAFKSI